MGDKQSSTPDPLSINQAAIIGLGLIGGSLGLALREAGIARRVVGWDPHCGPRAMERGVIDEAMPSAAEAVRGSEIVFLCAPLTATTAIVRDIAPAARSSCVVSDVGSVKSRVVAEAEPLLGGRFVGGHPMAGSEDSGVDSARADLFRDAPWLVTPTSRTCPEALRMVEASVRALGAIPRRCSPEEHDRIVAALSHLPHLVAFGLSAAGADIVPPEWRDAAAGSFRDGTRVAASSPDLWRDIFLENPVALLAALDSFETWTGELRSAIQAGDGSRITLLLQRAHNSKLDFHG